MSVYVGVNGIARKVSKIYVGDSNGIAREVKAGYVGVNGVARKVHNKALIKKPVSVRMTFSNTALQCQQAGISVAAASYPTTISKDPNITNPSYNPTSANTLYNSTASTQRGYSYFSGGYSITLFDIIDGIDSESAPWKMSFSVYMNLRISDTTSGSTSQVIITWDGSTVTTKVDDRSQTGSSVYFDPYYTTKNVSTSFYNANYARRLGYYAELGISSFNLIYT